MNKLDPKITEELAKAFDNWWDNTRISRIRPKWYTRMFPDTGALIVKGWTRAAWLAAIQKTLEILRKHDASYVFYQAQAEYWKSRWQENQEKLYCNKTKT